MPLGFSLTFFAAVSVQFLVQFLVQFAVVLAQNVHVVFLEQLQDSGGDEPRAVGPPSPFADEMCWVLC